MSALEFIARIKLASLRYWIERHKRNKRSRYIALALVANIVGYTLVYMLTLKGVGKWWANESVSKAMAPVGLTLNTLALTGRFKPTFGQAAKWTAWWVPSAIAGAYCTGFVVSNFEELGSLGCRAAAGVMIFPVDYGVKRFIIYYNTSLREKKEARNRFESSKTTSSEHVMRWRTGSA